MPDWAVVVLAAAAAAGAWLARPVPLVLACALVAFAFATRMPPMLWLAVALLTGTLAARSWQGLDPPAATAVRGATAVLVTDPRSGAGPGPPAVRVDARLAGRRVELLARGPAAVGALGHLLAGERAVVSGQLRPVAPQLRRWLAPRHVASRLDVTQLHGAAPGDRLSRIVNAARRAFHRGASVLPDTSRPLLAGLVLGDDRGQRPEVVHDFRASGLTHLLVVSGGNVAVALALVGPLLRRLSLPGRFAAGLAVLAVFGTLTRWEPSVLRAVAMAALSLYATLVGRPQPGVRLLALAVTGLLVVDPLLVHSVGFRLSVGAAAGILALAGPLARRLPGPRPFTHALAVTVGAQIGVAPVLVPTFGPIPVASLPANLLAAPAAGVTSLWGMAVGVPAGLLGSPAADVLHLPTRLLVAWVAAVARVGAALPLGSLGAAHVVVAGGALGVVLAARRASTRHLAASAAAVAALVAPALGPRPALDGTSMGRGALLWRSGGTAVVVLTAAADPVDVLDGLHRRRVRAVDLLVARSRTVDAVAAVRARHAVRLLVDPTTAADGATTTVGPYSVTFRHTRGGLLAEVARYGLPAATQASTAAVGRRPRSPSCRHSARDLAHARHRTRSSLDSWSLADVARLRPPPRAPPPAPPDVPPPPVPPARIRPSSRPAPLRRTMNRSNSSRWAAQRSSSQRRPSNPNSMV